MAERYALNPGRAVIRLWVFGSVFWIGVWGWTDFHKCIRAASGLLFCPRTIGDDALQRTDALHLFYFLLGPSLVSLAGGLLCWWIILRLQRSLGPK